MKKAVVIMVCLMAYLTPASYGQEHTPQKEKVPELKFKGGDTHDFGEVKKGPIVYYTFEFTNTGNAPLVINDINPSCGCTSVQFESANSGWDKMPVAPGKKGHIKVGLRTAEQHGDFLKDVYVKSNAGNSGPDNRYTIHIKGKAIEDPNNPSPPAPEHK